MYRVNRVSSPGLYPPPPQLILPSLLLNDYLESLLTHHHSYDYETGIIMPDVAEQAEQCMRNIAAALSEADTQSVSHSRSSNY